MLLRLVVVQPVVAVFVAALACPAASWGVEPLGSVVTDGPVDALVRAGHRVYVGGGFSYVGPSTGPVARLDINRGRRDGHIARLDGDVQTLIGDGEGGVFVGGLFTLPGDREPVGVAHLLADGTLDPGFAARLSGPVGALALGAGRLYAGVGVAFHYYPLQREIEVVALDVRTGAIDPEFSVQLARPADLVFPISPPSLGFGSTAPCRLDRVPILRIALSKGVTAMAVLGSRLYIGGGFVKVNGVDRQGLAAVDAVSGAVDEGFAPQGAAAGAPSSVRVLAATDDRLLVGGSGDDREAPTYFSLVALRPDTGAVDSTFRAGTRAMVRSVVVAGDRIYVGFASRQIFAGYSPEARKERVLALDVVTGRRIAGFHAPRTRGVGALAIAGGRVFVAVAGVRRQPAMMRALDAGTGRPVARFDVPANGPLLDMAASGSHLFVGGVFDSIGGARRFGLAALDGASGRLDDRFDPAGKFWVHGMAVARSRLYVAGELHTTGGHRRFGTDRGIVAFRLGNGRRDLRFLPSARSAGGPLAVVGRRVYSASLSGYLRAFDARTGARERGFHPTLHGTVKALAGSSSRLFAGVNVDGLAEPQLHAQQGVFALDPITGHQTPEFHTPVRLPLPISGAPGGTRRWPEVNALALARRHLYVGGDFDVGHDHARHLVALRPSTGEIAPTIADSQFLPTSLLLSSRRLVAVDGDHRFDNTVTTLGLSGRRIGQAVPVRGKVCSLAATASRLYVGGLFDAVAGDQRSNLAALSLAGVR